MAGKESHTAVTINNDSRRFNSSTLQPMAGMKSKKVKKRGRRKSFQHPSSVKREYTVGINRNRERANRIPVRVLYTAQNRIKV
jgi:hypothetical protein